MKPAWRQYLPIVTWLPAYTRQAASKDGVAAIIVTLMLVPQSLAYAIVAGLPPVYGLYASILPLVAYTLLGTSKTLAVGPVAVISLMTAEAIAPLHDVGTHAYVTAAATLAFLSGLMLLIMAVFRLGFLTTFLSHSVLSGFMTASGVVIIWGQLPKLLGLSAASDSLAEVLAAVHYPTLWMGLGSLVLLLLGRRYFASVLQNLGCSASWAGHISKLLPVMVMVASILIIHYFPHHTQGVSVVGAIPTGLPSFVMPVFEANLVVQLLPAALLISVVGFVESASVGQTLAAKRRQRIEPNQELIALGGANIASAIQGGFPVTGGLSRSVVNYDAGAETPLASMLTAIGIGITVLYFTPLFSYLPHAVLAAIIIVAVSALIDIKAIFTTWRAAKSDGVVMLSTIAGVLFINIEWGIIIGVLLSLVIFLWRTSQPHIAVVGLIEGSEHFRNVQRFQVKQSKTVLTLRIDESLYFANARYLEDKIPEYLASYPETQHLVLMLSGVNRIDSSALESLHLIAERVAQSGITMHLSEVKGPVMDEMRRSTFLEHFTGQIFISQFQAFSHLTQAEHPDEDWRI
ncbi:MULTISPECIES: SulP family inorganic anion transporter [Vibrio]|uniref:SulP family inorganic anion transporter n=1 Tax=Vibrio TaxID=662 RepID=UPI000D735429|nr:MULTISPECIES: sulfate permease [Vibrio]PXA74667.1 sodium-independent anion transporter [Vibrio sp. 11986-1-5]